MRAEKNDKMEERERVEGQPCDHGPECVHSRVEVGNREGGKITDCHPLLFFTEMKEAGWEREWESRCQFSFALIRVNIASVARKTPTPPNLQMITVPEPLLFLYFLLTSTVIFALSRYKNNVLKDSCFEVGPPHFKYCLYPPPSQ